MKLSVLANPSCHASDPGHIRIVGNPAGYIGRRYDAATGTYPVTGEADTYDCDEREGVRVLKMLRRGEVLPADKATADAAGVKFTQRLTNKTTKAAESAPEIK